MADFVISCVEPSGSPTTLLVPTPDIVRFRM